MFLLLWKKELKTFFSNPGNLLFMVLLPILLISMFSLALGDYIKGDYATFDDGKVFFYQDGCSAERLGDFMDIADYISESTGVTFVSVTDPAQARKDIEASKAYGLITVTDRGYDYFRSTFNEPQGGKIVRTLFTQMSDTDEHSTKNEVVSTVIQGNHLDSKVYYTFSAMTFAILFMGVLVGHSVISEKELGTILRIQISKAGVGSMMAGKILTGVLCGIGEVGAAFLFSNLVWGVTWGVYLPVVLLVLLCLILLSASFGAAIGRIVANKSMCQSTVMMTAMLCGYLGGAITPLYLLENMPVLQLLVKISPLYWTNQALICLYNGILNEKTAMSAGVLLSLTLVVILFTAVFGNKRSRSTKGGAA